jgi:hypothetical protein
MVNMQSFSGAAEIKILRAQRGVQTSDSIVRVLMFVLEQMSESIYDVALVEAGTSGCVPPVVGLFD